MANASDPTTTYLRSYVMSDTHVCEMHNYIRYDHMHLQTQCMDALQHITSHHITSHHITSHHITSHHITSHHITSHHITSHHITSHHITRQDLLSHIRDAEEVVLAAGPAGGAQHEELLPLERRHRER